MVTPSSAARPFQARSSKFMPRWPRPLELVLETISCDFSELLVGHLYNLYKSKRARKFALPAPPTMQICEGASFPRRMLGLLSWSYPPTCSANESDPSRRGGPAFHPRSLFPNSVQLLFFRVALSFDTSRYFIFARCFFVCFFHDTLFLAAFKMGVKYVRTSTIFMIAPRCLLLLLHDIYVCTAMLIFRRFTIIYFLPSRFIVCRFTIVIFAESLYRSALHDSLIP